MDISDHLGKPKRFSSDGLVTENQKAQQMLQFAELSLKNERPSFHNLTFLLMLKITLLHFNSASSQYFMIIIQA